MLSARGLRVATLAALAIAFNSSVAAPSDPCNGPVPTQDQVKAAFGEIETFCKNRRMASLNDCKNAISIDNCYTTIEQLPTDQVLAAERQNADEAKEIAAAMLEDLKSEATPLQVPGFANALPNLLPGALLGGVQPLVNKLDDPHTLGTLLNLPFLPFKVNAGHIVDLQGKVFIAPSPAVNPVLKAHLADTDRADVLNAAQDDAKPWDDLLWEVSVSPLSPWFGRDPGWYYDDLTEIASAVAGPEPEEVGRARDLYCTVADERYDTVEGKKAAACLGAVQQDVQLAHALSVRRYNLNRFATLVNHQPQLVYTFRGLRRAGAVGANAHSHRFTFSTGLMNNIDFLRLACRGSMSTPRCASAFDAMAGGFWNLNSTTLAAYYEFGNLATFTFDIPAASALGSIPSPLPLPPPVGDGQAEHFVVDGGRYRQWGASIGLKIPGCADFSLLKLPLKLGEKELTPACRIDLAYDRTTYEESVVRADHWVGRLTFTYRLGIVSIPIHLVYRDKTEFDADVADRFGAAIGTGVSW